MGLCKTGSEACVGGKWSGSCSGEVTPKPEVCDGSDDDCNGKVDDSPKPITPCGVQDGVCKGSLRQSCSGGRWQFCEKADYLKHSADYEEKESLCDGKDNDCNGTIDGFKRKCYSGSPNTAGVGACRQGEQTCSNGNWGACAGEVIDSKERCDGLDNDCDGQTDEGIVGCVRTLAGSVSGFSDGKGSSAQFNGPHGITVDANGNLYVGDIFNNRVRQIDGQGNVSTYAGSTQGKADGTRSAATFYHPHGVSIDSTNKIMYVADKTNNQVRSIQMTTGAVTTLSHSFSSPHALVAGAGVVYVADTNNFKFRKLDIASGKMTTLASGFSFGTSEGLTLGPTGTLYVSDTSKHVIRAIDLSTGGVSTVAGDGKCRYDSQSSAYVDCFRNGAALQAQFYFPKGLAYDAKNKRLYVADSNNHCVRAIDLSLKAVSTFAGQCKGSIGPGTSKDGDKDTTALFSRPTGLVLDAKGDLYVTDISSGRIRKITLVP